MNQPGASLSFVSWLGVYENSWKLDPEINNRAYQTQHRLDLAAQGMAEVTVLSTTRSTRPAVAEITCLGGDIRARVPRRVQWAIDVTIRVADVPALAELETVQFIEDGPEATFRNDTNRWIVQSNVANQTPIWNKGIHGEGQVGGLIDGTMSECTGDVRRLGRGRAHAPKGRELRSPSGTDTHGTHTAGTFAGDASPFGNAPPTTASRSRPS